MAREQTINCNICGQLLENSDAKLRYCSSLCRRIGKSELRIQKRRRAAQRIYERFLNDPIYLEQVRQHHRERERRRTRNIAYRQRKRARNKLRLQQRWLTDGAFRERIRQKRREYYQRNREKYLARYQQNKDQILEYRRHWNERRRQKKLNDPEYIMKQKLKLIKKAEIQARREKTDAWRAYRELLKTDPVLRAKKRERQLARRRELELQPRARQKKRDRNLMRRLRDRAILTAVRELGLIDPTDLVNLKANLKTMLNDQRSAEGTAQ